MKRYALAKGTPYVKTSAMILGERQIDVFEALVLVTGRRPHELVADIVLDYIRENEYSVADVVRTRRLHQAERRGIHLVR